MRDEIFLCTSSLPIDQFEGRLAHSLAMGAVAVGMMPFHTTYVEAPSSRSVADMLVMVIKINENKVNT